MAVLKPYQLIIKNSYKKYLIMFIVIYFVLICLYLIAQENILNHDSLHILQNIENINSNFNLNNAAMIQQVGSFNEANINQAGNSGILPNVAEINQQGYNNFASSNQNGKFQPNSDRAVWFG